MGLFKTLRHLLAQVAGATQPFSLAVTSGSPHCHVCRFQLLFDTFESLQKDRE